MTDPQAGKEKVVLVRIAGAVNRFVLADEAVADMRTDVPLAGERSGRIDAVADLRHRLRRRRAWQKQRQQRSEEESGEVFGHRRASAHVCVNLSTCSGRGSPPPADRA